MNMFNVNKVKEGFYKQNIYIFENPAVFYYLCQIVKEKQLNVGLICSHGQINLCTYQLLDKLVNSKCTLYYAGDFDPEGLQIADKLKSRYKDNLNLLGYQKSYFDLIKVKKQSISLRRLQLLNQINHKQLEIIADCIIKSLSFGYQEGLIKKYCERIIEDNSL